MAATATLPAAPAGGATAQQQATTRQFDRAKRNAKKKDQAEKPAEAGGEISLGEKTNLAGQLVTARLLNSAWLAIPETFGLSLLYVNFHFVMAHIVRSSLFCMLGQEWQFGGKMKYTPSSALMWVEIIILIAINIMMIAMLVVSLAMFILMILPAVAPGVALGILGSELLNLIGF
ncbi:MAG TPA: hypothetical protein VGA49_00035 [Patescibacteria group bacterium]